jgi:hypothetical protein
MPKPSNYIQGPSNKRLQKAREMAGFKSRRQAALHFGWTESTYSSHENGQIPTVPREAAKIYAEAFNLPGLDYVWITDGVGPGPRPRSRKGVRAAEKPDPKSRHFSNSEKQSEGETQAIATLSTQRTQVNTEISSQMSMRITGDGHRVDPALAGGELKDFFDREMGPGREAWHVTTDMIDTLCRLGSYVVVDRGRRPEPGEYVLAEITNSKPTPVFRISNHSVLIEGSTRPSGAPVLIVDDSKVVVVGVIVAYWQPEQK